MRIAKVAALGLLALSQLGLSLPTLSPSNSTHIADNVTHPTTTAVLETLAPHFSHPRHIPETSPTLMNSEPWSPGEITVLAASGKFAMIKDNMNKISWHERYQAWEEKQLQSSSKQSLSARYAKDMLGESEWVCDPDNGCASKPNARAILDFVNTSLPDMPRGERLEEAQARYWASMYYWIFFRSASNTINALQRGETYLSSRLDSIITEFTKQDDMKAVLFCSIKKWFIGQIIDASFTVLGIGLGKVPDYSMVPAGSQQVPGINHNKKVADAGITIWMGIIKNAVQEFAPLGLGYEYPYWEKHPEHNPDDPDDFLRLLSLTHTNDLYCGTMDGITGTGADSMIRLSDSKFHLSQIMRGYLKSISQSVRSLNGLESSKNSMKMSEWMMDANYEDAIHRLDDVDISRNADDFRRKLEGYFISAVWASNKCYMKCQSGMNPDHVTARCKDEKFAKERMCPFDALDTLCQVNCYTMIHSRNHEKPLIGLGNLEKHGFTIEEVKDDSWEQYKKLSNTQRKPQLDLESGDEFQFNMGKSALTLSVSVSKANVISDKPLKSKNFPCFSGDWRGLETEEFMNRLSMGAGSQDWGEPQKGNPRAWEIFQSQCPEETREMAPFTRFLNLVCGLHLRWPDPVDWHQKDLIMKPDLDNENQGVCSALRTRAKDLNEQTANIMFCSGTWPEAQHIFSTEGYRAYTDYGADEHRYTGLRYMLNHKDRCAYYLKHLPKSFQVDSKLLSIDGNVSNTNISMITGPDADFTGSALEGVESEQHEAPIEGSEFIGDPREEAEAMEAENVQPDECACKPKRPKTLKQKFEQSYRKKMGDKSCHCGE